MVKQRKRAPGGGRKPGLGGAKKANFNTRITPETRAGLEALVAAENKLARQRGRAGTNISELAESLLLDGIQRRELAERDPAIFSLYRILNDIHRRTGFQPEGQNWRTNRYVFEAFKVAFNTVMDALAPEGDASETKHVMFESPQEFGETVAKGILLDLQTDTLDVGVKVRAGIAEHWFTLPKAGKALGIKQRSFTQRVKDELAEQRTNKERDQ